MKNILVTAVGSELAFSILKAISNFKVKPNVFGCDIYSEVVGKYWVDTFFQVPMAVNEKEYLDSIVEIVRSKRINILIPSTDAEIKVLSKYIDFFLEKYNCHVLVNNHDDIIIFDDKWLSHCWYERYGIPSSLSILVTAADDLNEEELGGSYPFIVKPRKGGGSRHIYKVNSRKELLDSLRVVPEPIVQSYLGPDDEEYTIGTYRTKLDEVYSIILKRTLKFGMTNTAEVVFNKDLDNFARDVILRTNLVGSNNIQCRLTEDGPKVLEINPRFSGTTAIRAQFGFNDVEMWVNEVCGEKILRPDVNAGFVLRYMEEQYHFDGK